MSEFVVEVPVGVKPGERFTAGVGKGMRVTIVCPPDAVAGEPINIKLNPDGGDAIVLDASKLNIFTAICPKNKRPGDSFDVTDPTGTRMRVIVPHGIKPGQRFSVRGRGTSKQKSGMTASTAPAFAVHKEERGVGALSATSKMSFSWRFVYTKQEHRTREHSLFVKYSVKSRQLRAWIDGSKKVDTTLSERNTAVVQRVPMEHRGHKLMVKILLNEQMEAHFYIDGHDFDKLPQPDQITSRSVCVPHAIAIMCKKEDVGKMIASSKQRFTWEFKFPDQSQHHVLVMTWSSSTIRVFLDNAQIFMKTQKSVFRGDTVFDHLFPSGGSEFRLLINRLSAEESTTNAPETIVTFMIGGTRFSELPKSQQEYDLRHSRELIKTLRRRSNGAIKSSSLGNKDGIEKLRAMGFGTDESVAALLTYDGDVHKALEVLLANRKKREAADKIKTEEKKKDVDVVADLFESALTTSSPAKQDSNDLVDLFSTETTSAPPASDDPFMQLASTIVDGAPSVDKSTTKKKTALPTSTSFHPPSLPSSTDPASNDPFADLF